MGQSPVAQSPPGGVGEISRKARPRGSWTGTLLLMAGAGQVERTPRELGEERSPSSCYRK